MRVTGWADRHTRTVNFLKLVLPLLALAILSSLFIFSKVIDPEAGIPYATFDVENRLREPKITDANYAAVTADGTAVAITVKTAIPNGTKGGSALLVVGQIISKSGDVTDLTATNLAYTDGKAALTGGVEIRSGGYVMNTDALDLVLAQVSATSRGVVRATGALGNLQAGKMRITAAKDGKSDYLLVFNSGVHLIYTPAK